MKKRFFIIISFVFVTIYPNFCFAFAKNRSTGIGVNQLKNHLIENDTTLRFPIKKTSINNYEELLKKYPLDLKDPKNIKTDVEYNIKTGNYIVRKKIGDIEIESPLVLTPQEYSDYILKKRMQEYWIEKNFKGVDNNENKFSVTDMKFVLGAADKIFGPGGVQLQTQGSAELIFGFKTNVINNPALPERARKSYIPNFDQKIQMNVVGSVGNKISFNMNYNTDAQFDFDKKLAKLSFKGKEDDIIQLLEAGNVSMPLQSSLITGSSALMGIRTNLKFGKLSISAVVSQQESESKTVSTKGGAQTNPFEVKIDQYDDNRHFFLSHCFRDDYESSMSNLPFISSGITINRVEVWVTNKRGNFNQARNIIAFMDLGEPRRIDNQHWVSQGGNLSSNKSNSLYSEITAIPNVRDVKRTNAILSQNYISYNINGGEDYEKIESARRLSPSEYTVNKALGFISLRSALNPDEVLAVAYEYTYGGKVYQVGEFSTDNIKAPDALILKLLKGTTQSPQLATWDLMMKNIYSIGANQMSKEDFELNIFYQNDSIGTEMQYITQGNIANKLLLRVMNLDKLDTKNATNPDGKFDFIEGYTALSSSGRIIFPMLEPFGEYLKKQIGNDAIAEKYIYQELYDSTLVVAQEYSEKNKFLIKGRYQGSAGGSEIILNATNIPRGSVVVTAGGATLVENVDYTIDYMMGRVTILNQSILESNTNIDVRLENQTMFNLQRKSLLGTHLEYEFSKNFILGGTIMHLSEMPLTKKVNTGSEPIKNTIFGINTAWKTESQWLTNLIDKIPFLDATQPSSISLNAEYAQLLPGHSDVISNTGLAYIDDFESTQTSINIHYPHSWYLASTPYNPTGLFPEAGLSNNIDYGKNRALLAWYSIDPVLNGESGRTPANLRGNSESQSNHYTREVRETELFPNRDIDPTRSSLLTLMNLSYYPNQRGPYNLDADNINSDGTLKNPKKRWGGIMRQIETSDFETSNIEYFEFWLMDPFVYNDGTNKGGDLYINLGNISEDILKDGKKSFENGLPIDNNENNIETTVWGRVPRTQSTVTAFDNAQGARAKQDVGLNGLSSQEELLFPAYQEFLQKLRTKLDANTIAQMLDDPHSPFNDPAGDNYRFYLNKEFDKKDASILERYKYYNNTEGNSPDASQNGSQYSESATLSPDVEDINADNTLNEYEKYYQYRISLRPEDMVVGKNRINDVRETSVYLKNGKVEKVKWYQFKVPVRKYDEKIGSIRNFKSIRFMRIFLTDFEKDIHLRLATFDLVRGEWKPYTKPLSKNATASNSHLDLLAINIEENGHKKPVNYILPPGITRETDPSQPQLIQENEQALVMKVSNLSANEAQAVYKNTNYDMRQYKRFQMFVHAEAMLEPNAVAQNLQDNELACFVRIGSDMVNNYYEYEIPLKLTPEGIYTSAKLSDRKEVWPKENMFDFAFTTLTKAKLERNKQREAGVKGVSNVTPYIVYDKEKPKNKITILGNPSLSNVENIMIGVRNNTNSNKSGEIWVNEMRMSEFDEEGGFATMANLSVNLSDLGSINVSGRMETAGFGGVESNISTRKQEDMYQLNLSAAFDFGRFFPEKAKIRIPAYYTFSTENHSPKYNPLDEDILLKDAIKSFSDDKRKIDSLKQRTQNNIVTQSFNITNAKINLRSKKSMPYDPANFSFTYSVNQTNEHTPEIEQNLMKQQRASIEYSYNPISKPWEPFKKSKALRRDEFKIIKDFNLYYLPTYISYTSTLNRNYSHIKLRDLTGQNYTSFLDNLTFSKDFMWKRQFNLQYSLTKSLKFGLQTAMDANIDEGYYTPELGKSYYENWRDTVWSSIKRRGTPYTYQQLFNASWKVPIKKLPYLDWIQQTSIQYNSTYNWNKSNLMQGGVNIGNVASSMRRWTGNVKIDLESLYKKSKFLRDVINRGKNKKRRRYSPKTFVKIYSISAKDTVNVVHSLGTKKIIFTAKNKKGKRVELDYKVKDKKTVQVFPKRNMGKISINITTKDPNDRTLVEQITDFVIHLPMAIRKISLSYDQSNSLTLPGFMPEPGFMGQSMFKGKKAPGWKYVFGFYENDFLTQAKENDWLYLGQDVINPAYKAFTSDLNIRASIEPIAGLGIELSAKRQMKSKSVIHYMYDGMPSTFNGSFNITQISIRTAFDKLGTAANNYQSDAFDRFLHNRKIIATRLEQRYKGSRYPTTGFFSETPQYAGKEFDVKNGTFDLNSPDVLIPAFLSAYTGRDANSINTNPFLSLLDILPNWALNYNGLSKIPLIKKYFKSITLNHVYSNRYSIGNYTSFSTWVASEGNDAMGYIRDVQNNLPIPSMPYDISAVSFIESFTPFLGVNMTMKNSMTAKAEYRKQRNLSLNLTSTQLIETLSDEFVVGIGYVVNDFDVILKLKSNRTKNIKNDLKLKLDLSYKNMKSLIRKINENVTQASSGNKIMSLKFTADYVFSRKINLQLFFDHQSTAPLVSSSYPVSSTNLGLSFKFMLTR